MPILYRVFPDAPMVVYVTSTSYASSHPQVVREFANAMTTANATLSTSPAMLKSVGAHVAKMTAGQIANVILPTYVPTPVSLDALQNVMKVMMEYKVLAAPVNFRSHVYGK
jgi:NitT/TauT family transport system substrate-binding protein